MPGHDVIVIGASAGGVEAVAEIAAALPADLPAAVFVTLHFPSQATSVLPAILNRAGKLPAFHPKDHDPIRPGRIYVAPPGKHLLVHRDAVRLVFGPRENGHRPAIDTLFRSAAKHHGPRVVGVVLSGLLDDGSAGLVAIQQRGGKVVVQDPDDALFPSMPQSALASVEADHVARLADVGPLLARLAHEEAAPATRSASPLLDYEVRVSELDGDGDAETVPGERTFLSCPECRGGLWEIREGELIRFRCMVGHAYAPESLVTAQSTALEAALWSALRGLEERAALCRRIARRMTERRLPANSFTKRAEDAERHAETIRAVLRKSEIAAATAEGAIETEGFTGSDDRSRRASAGLKEPS